MKQEKILKLQPNSEDEDDKSKFNAASDALEQVRRERREQEREKELSAMDELAEANEELQPRTWDKIYFASWLTDNKNNLQGLKKELTGYYGRYAIFRKQIVAAIGTLEEQQKSHEQVAHPLATPPAESLLPAPSASGAARAAHSGKRVSFAPRGITRAMSELDMIDESLGVSGAAAAPRTQELDVDTLDLIERDLNQIERLEVGEIRKTKATAEQKLLMCDQSLGNIQRNLNRMTGRYLNARGQELLVKAEQLKKEAKALRQEAARDYKIATTDAKFLQNNADRKMARLGKLFVGGVVASVALVAALVWYFKYFKPAAAAQ